MQSEQVIYWKIALIEYLLVVLCYSSNWKNVLHWVNLRTGSAHYFISNLLIN